jgi:hypothetical protein
MLYPLMTLLSSTPPAQGTQSQGALRRALSSSHTAARASLKMAACVPNQTGLSLYYPPSPRASQTQT